MNIIGTDANDNLIGISEDDFIRGMSGSDTLYGNTGNDTLDGGSQGDTMYGGQGNDVYYWDDRHDKVVEYAGEGYDSILFTAPGVYLTSAQIEYFEVLTNGGVQTLGNTLDNVFIGNVGSDSFSAGSGNDTMWGISGADTLIGGIGEDRLYGGEGDDSLNGGPDNDTLIGSSGKDILYGGLGNDLLDGGDGVDDLTGGDGSDTYVLHDLQDFVHEDAVRAGIDTVEADITISSLHANVENLVLVGAALINGTGNELNNVITGNEGANSLYGADGSDTVKGQGGDDRLYGGAGNDLLDGGTGNDYLGGGTGNDTYLFSRGGGQDNIVDIDSTVGNTDVLQFQAGIAHDQLWFSQSGNNLTISVIGTSDSIMIAGGAGGTNFRIEQLTAGGKTLSHTQAANLVQAMASMTPPAMGQTTLSAAQQAQLAPVLAANWS